MDNTNQSHKTVYRFNDYTLNVETYELWRGDCLIELEPKLFKILSILVKQQHRVVTKEELLQEVWDKRVVTDNAISRAIYQLRKIIDSSDSHTLIKTIRGVGYQLNCPVETQVTERNKPTSITGNNKANWLLSGLLIMGLMVASYFFLPSDTYSPDDSGQDQQNLIAILPLHFDKVKSDYINLANTLIDYLTIELQSGLGVRVIHPDRLMTLDETRNSINQVHDSTRATHILESFVSEPSADVMRLHLTLYQKTRAVDLEPYSLGHFDFPWPDSDLNLQAVHKARKLTVSEITKLIKPESRFQINQNMQTTDPMAFRLVIASHHSVANDQCQGVVHAIDLLQQAVDRDPQYVYAWHQLMTVYFKSIWLCGLSNEYYEKALAAADQVDILAKGVFPSVAIARNAVLIETNRVEQAYKSNLQYGANQTNLIYLKVSNLRYAGFLKLAKQQIDKILAIDPYFYSSRPINSAPNTLLYLNDYESHLALMTVPGHIYHDYYRALNFYVRGKTKAALETLSIHKTNNPTSTFDRFVMGLYHICMQQFDQAREHIDAVVDLRRNQVHEDGEMTYKQAQLYAMIGDQEAALEQLKLSLKQGFFPAQYWQNDPALITIVDDPRFASLFKQAQQRHHAFAKQFGLSTEF